MKPWSRSQRHVCGLCNAAQSFNQEISHTLLRGALSHTHTHTQTRSTCAFLWLATDPASLWLTRQVLKSRTMLFKPVQSCLHQRILGIEKVNTQKQTPSSPNSLQRHAGKKVQGYSKADVKKVKSFSISTHVQSLHATKRRQLHFFVSFWS